MQIVTALAIGLHLFDWYAVRVGPRILADAGYLPRNLHARRAAGDFEMIVGNLFGDIERRPGSADRGQQVPKVSVECPEPFRQFDDRFSSGIQSNHTIIDVHHVGRFDERMIQVLVRRIGWMINLERATALRQVAGDRDIAEKLTSQPGSGAAGPAARY